nr:large surface protein PMAC_C2.5 [Pneumocystis sp. 'macacae']
MLDKYCIQLTNKTTELEDLCTNTTNTKNDTEVRKEFCKGLLNRIEEKCIKLKNEFTEIKHILAKKQDYESIKEKAEKEMNTMNLVLLTAKTLNNKSASEVIPNTPNGAKDTLQFKLIRKSIETSMAKDDLVKLGFLSKTFELVAKAFDLYVKLKGICQDSTKGCEFKKECKTESLCEEIEKVCLELKPLKINSERVTVIQNTTVITIKTQTTEVVKETQCTLTHTTNAWITHTLTNTAISTHTSILTSLVFLTTEKYRPTKFTTEGETGEIWPSQGLRMTGWSLKGAIFIMIISAII